VAAHLFAVERLSCHLMTRQRTAMPSAVGIANVVFRKHAALTGFPRARPRRGIVDNHIPRGTGLNQPQKTDGGGLVSFELVTCVRNSMLGTPCPNKLSLLICRECLCFQSFKSQSGGHK
jgi:hypothetical protein